MATTPNFPATSNFGGGKVQTANTGLDGTGTVGTNLTLLFTAGPNGARIDEITALHMGTNVATALRLFVNNGSAPTTATNNFLYKDITASANTVSQVAGQTPMTLLSADSSALVLPAGYRLYASVGTTIASGIMLNVVGGDF